MANLVILVFSKAKVAYEIKGEIIDIHLLGVYRFKGELKYAFQSFMEYINEIRKDELYEHKLRDCHEHCRARGCGVSFSVDGLWKIRFAITQSEENNKTSTEELFSNYCLFRHVHCMWKLIDQNHDRLGGNMPPVCTGEPVRGNAFCKNHCEVVAALGWPQKLRDFLLKCGTNPSGFNKDSAKRVDSVLTDLAKTAELQQGSTSTECQNVFTKTTNYFLRSQAVSADDFSASTPATTEDDRCNKVS